MAFESLYERYNTLLCRYFIRMVGNDGVGCELTQETFLRAWEGLPRLRAPDRFASGLYRIATNCAYTYQDRAKHLPSVSWKGSGGDQLRVDGPEEQVEETELLRPALASVLPTYRPSLILYVIEELPQRQIANLLKIKVICERVCQPGKRRITPDLSPSHEGPDHFDERRAVEAVSHRPPCTAWAEKLALLSEVLSPAELLDLEAYIRTCPACEAAQADYHFLDARRRALPSPIMQPLPRLPLLSLREIASRDKLDRGGSSRSPSQPPSKGPQVTYNYPFTAAIKEALIYILIAGLLLALLLAFGGSYINLSGAHTTDKPLVTYERHTDVVAGVAWSPDGKYIASASWDHTVQFWQAISQSEFGTGVGERMGYAVLGLWRGREP